MVTQSILCRIPEPLAKRMKKDAVEHGVSMQDYTALCYKEFLSNPINVRRAKFDRVSRKIEGRKIKL